MKSWQQVLNKAATVIEEARNPSMLSAWLDSMSKKFVAPNAVDPIDDDVLSWVIINELKSELNASEEGYGVPESFDVYKKRMTLAAKTVFISTGLHVRIKFGNTAGCLLSRARSALAIGDYVDTVRAIESCREHVKVRTLGSYAIEELCRVAILHLDRPSGVLSSILPKTLERFVADRDFGTLIGFCFEFYGNHVRILPNLGSCSRGYGTDDADGPE